MTTLVTVQIKGKHSLRSCYLPSIMILSLKRPFLPILPFFFSKNALSQGKRHVHLTLDISLSPRYIDRKTANIDRMTHEARFIFCLIVCVCGFFFFFGGGGGRNHGQCCPNS